MVTTHNIIFHRPGGLNLTKRWADGELPVIAENDWDGDEPPQAIQFSTEFKVPLDAIVRRTSWKPGDADGRPYTDAEGKLCWKTLPMYAIADPKQFRETFHQHVTANAQCWAAAQQALPYREALRLIEENKNQSLVQLLEYDYGRWLKTKSAKLTGANKLGIDPLPTDSVTMPGEVPVPRLITAQADNVNSIVIEPLLEAMFGPEGTVTQLLNCATEEDTHLGYVALDILTHGSIGIFDDMVRRGQQQPVQVRETDGSLQSHSILGGEERVLNPKELEDIRRSLTEAIDSFGRSLVRHGQPPRDIMARLSKAARLYHADVEGQPHPGPNEWRNPRFWLPPLKVLYQQTLPTTIRD